MWRVPVSIGPSFLAREHRVWICKAFGGDQPLERGQPVVIITGAVVGLATIFCVLELGSERGRPLLPGEMTLLGKSHRERERLRFPRLGKDRLRWNRIRRAQDSRPTYRHRPRRAATLAHPTAPG